MELGPTVMFLSLRLLVSVLIVAAVSAQTSAVQSAQRIYDEYLKARKPPNIERLVSLDRELRQLTSPTRAIATRALRSEWQAIGLVGAPFDAGYVVYTGKLLADAHQDNPGSPYRSATLYATVFPNGDENRNRMPVLPAAEAYLREFPAGTFAVEASLTLAHFYDDLFKLLQDRIDRGRSAGYKEDCFARYVTAEPLADQRRRIQQTGLGHYNRAATLSPGDASIRASTEKLQRGTTTG